MQTIENDNQDIFGDVIDIVTESQPLDLDLSRREWADGSLESCSNWTNTTDGILKRKPSRENLKDSKKVSLNYSNTEKAKIMIENSCYRSPISVGAQLQRLQNNLISTLSKRRTQHEAGRQRKIVKRIKADKQNKYFGASLEITSQQLRSIGEEDQQLKEILLTISRFYQKQKDKNQQLETQLSVLNRDIQEAESALQSEKKQVELVKRQVQCFRRQAGRQEIEVLRRMVIKNEQ